MSSWVAIPHAALAAAGPVAARRLGVLDLYERAHQVGYGWMPWTERELGEAWGCDRRHVRALLASLESAGCVEIVRSDPGTRAPSRMRVIAGVNQTRAQNANQNPGRSVNQGANQRRQGPPVVVGSVGEPDHEPESGTVTEPEPEPDPGPPRARQHARGSDQETRPDLPSPNPSPSGGGASPVDLVLEVLDRAIPDPVPPEGTELEVAIWRSGLDDEIQDRDRRRRELWRRAAKGDIQLATEVLAAERARFGLIGITRARKLAVHLVVAARQRGPPDPDSPNRVDHPPGAPP